MGSGEGLEGLRPEVAAWFRATFGRPTPPQARGWPEIASGRNVLLCAPTGSGKTLAAFLACLDYLWRHPRTRPGVRVLYVSPLKALNQDVYRNLRVPLEGITRTAEALGSPLPGVTVAVRTGDTPASERQRLARRPPDILITTPESLHLMLTSKVRETLRSISHVIVDEIHAVCPNKRGVFLALLLERLEALNPENFVRIGLSATQRPLEEVARYLGGLRRVRGEEGSLRYEPRPVTVIDTGQRKQLDLEVSVPGPFFQVQPGRSVWPAIERRLFDLIQTHKSTIVFANNRRVSERLTARLNDLAQVDDGESPGTSDPRHRLRKTTAPVGLTEVGPESPRLLLSGPTSVGPTRDPPARGPFSEAGFPELARAHHGSLSLEQRRATEEALKRGELRAVVATASLELGIDMGAVDLVCQVESPSSVARGLQRVGRAGHQVGQASKGRLIAKTAGDLLESAALARAMLQGAVETLRVPTGCLDVLAQQVIACVAIDAWDVPALYAMVRGAYPFRDLTAAAFESVLELVSGRFHAGEMPLRDLRPRVSWDRIHNRLYPLPGTAQLALVGGGTIPDTGQYPLYLGEGGPKLGELDEEFVLERRVGETFVLGTTTWKIEAIEPHRVVVSRAEGQAAFVPFWRGEVAHRTPQLGEAVGALCREIAGRLEDPNLLGWLRSECRLDDQAARALRDFITRQVRHAGAVPDDRTVLIETFRDPTGELGLAVLTPFGATLHQALKLVLQARLRQRLGVLPACLHGDDGVLIRLPQTEEPPLDLFDGLTPERAEALIREELGDCALFGLRFRQNAGRALLMPRPDPAKRTPLWLQRLRAKDLLQVARQFPDFPIVVETYRECLNDDLDLPRLRRFLEDIAQGTIRVVTRRGEIASPFASELIFQFTLTYLYEWDEPRRRDVPRGASAGVDHGLLSHLLDPRAIGRVEGRLRGQGRPPRTIDEMAETLRHLGDLTADELTGPMLGFLKELEAQGRALLIDLPGTSVPSRWISAEEATLYALAFADEPDEAARATIVRRFLRNHALVGLAQLVARYPIDPAAATELLEHWASEDGLVRLKRAAGGGPHWADRRNLDEIQRLSLAIRRQESVAVRPEVFADFLLRRQGVHPETRREGAGTLGLVLEQLQGFAAPADVWETEVLPRRIRAYRPAWLDEALAVGGWTWRAEGDTRGEPRVAFAPRGFGGGWPSPRAEVALGEAEKRVLDHLRNRGASFVAEIARATGLGPSLAREALQSLLQRGLATNDRFDPLRPSARGMAEALALASRASLAQRPSLGRPRASLRRPASERPEGRWAVVRDERAEDPEEALLVWAAALLDRYGVLTRETVALDLWAPPWRDLAPVLARAEWRGELRRGYFVEGLSGVQYASSDAAEELARLAALPAGEAPPLLLCSLDPANLYGSGAPLDIPLLDGGTARLVRSAANSLVLVGGRPVLIIEGQGRRLTGLASASEAELRSALALLPTLAGPSRRVLKVETYNGMPTLASPAAPWLAELGLVRDPPGMAYYAGW
jgi:ATP-dependent Lhr-like helicase